MFHLGQFGNLVGLYGLNRNEKEALRPQKEALRPKKEALHPLLWTWAESDEENVRQ